MNDMNIAETVSSLVSGFLHELSNKAEIEDGS